MLVVTTRRVLWLILSACVVTGVLAFAGAAQARVPMAPLLVEPGQWTITADAGPGGSISPSGDVGVDPDGAQSFTITPDAHYHVADVLVDGGSVGAVLSYPFETVQADHTIHATFAIDTFTITVTQGLHGTITPGTGSVDYGASPTYTITPDTGYHLASLTVDGASQTLQGSWTFTNVTANHSIAATFAINTFTITVTPGCTAAITPGTGSVDYGASPTYTITPDTGYHLASLTVDGASQTLQGSWTFTNVTANHSITATFAINTFTITVTQGLHGTITPGTGSVDYGASPTYTITPDTGYHLASLTVDGASQTLQGSWTFTNVTANHSIAATFAINTFTITVTQGLHGTITPGTGSVDYGASPTYTITPDTGYHLASLTVDGASQTLQGSWTFTNVTANHSIAATFAINTFTITVTAGLNGSISPTGAQSVDWNGASSYTITPDTDYHLANVMVDTPGTGSVDYGASPAYTITPDTGYHLASLTVDGASQTLQGSWTFTNVTANHSIAATFAINTFTITVTQGLHGTITPGTGSVDYGASPTYTITPDTGYHIASLTVDGVPQTVASSWTFTNVVAAHTIAATFAIDTFSITVSAGLHGSISPTGPEVVVDFGSGITFIILPDAGYRVDDVKVDGVSQGAVDHFDFTSVTADHSISATFTQGVPTSLEAKQKAFTVTYGRATTLVATLVKSGDGTPITGAQVALWASASTKGPWAQVDSATTSAEPGAEGTCSLRVVPEASMFYMLRYSPPQGSDLAAAPSWVLRIGVRPVVGKPSRPSTVKAGKTFTVSGTLAPHIAKGSASVRIRVYRQKGKTWRPFSRLTAAIADKGGASKYSGRLKIKRRGTYRFRAEFPAASGWAKAASKYSGKMRVR